MTSHAVVPKTSTKKSFLVIFDDFWWFFDIIHTSTGVSAGVSPRKNSNSSLRSDTLKWISNMEKVHPSSRHHKVRHSVGTPLPMIIHIPETILAQKNTTYNASETCRGYVWTIMYFLHNDTTQSHLILDIFSSRVHPYNTRIFQNSSQSSDSVDSWSKLPSKCG